MPTMPDFPRFLARLYDAMPDAKGRFGRLTFDGPLPWDAVLLPVPEEATDRATEAYATMRRAAAALGVAMEMRPTWKKSRKADFGVTGPDGSVTLKSTLHAAHSAHVGFHEIVHAFFQRGSLVATERPDEYMRKEREAEIAAYFCTAALGIPYFDSPLYLAIQSSRRRDIQALERDAMARSMFMLAAGREAPTLAASEE